MKTSGLAFNKKGMLKHYSIIPNDRPEWLEELNRQISRRFDDAVFFEHIPFFEYFKTDVDEKIEEIKTRGNYDVRGEITTKVIRDEGREVLHINRNDKTIEIYYIKFEDE